MTITDPLFPATPPRSTRRERSALAVGTGALSALQIALCTVEAYGTAKGIALTDLGSERGPCLVVRMSTADSAYLLAEELKLDQRRQVPSSRRHDGNPSWWAQSYAGMWGALIRVLVVAVADQEWDGLDRMRVGDSDAIAAVLGAVTL